MYIRTIRVFPEMDQLMLQEFGELPEALFKQADGNFAIRSSPEMIISFIRENNNSFMSMAQASFIDNGLRIGNADVKTFHGAAFKNLK